MNAGVDSNPKRPPLGFALGIIPIRDNDGEVIDYQVQSESIGLPQEAVITIIRTWLRMIEENYYSKFIGQK